MTEQERAFEAWWKDISPTLYTNSNLGGWPDLIKQAYLQGWERKRARAKPLVMTICPGHAIPEKVFGEILEWSVNNQIELREIKVTVEEL